MASQAGPHHASVRRRFSGGRRDGFSLLELTVVLIMMSIIAGMAVPRLNYERYRADGAMRTVRSALMGAQRSAIMRQTDIVVAFDIAGKRMALLEDANNNCVQDAGERVSVRPLEEGTRFAMPASPYPGTTPANPVEGPSLCTLSGNSAVAFLRDGAANSDVDIYVSSSRNHENERMIRVTMATGRTESFRYNGSQWVRYN